MGLAVVDASVLIATIDDQDVHHERARSELLKARAEHTLTFPAVAFSEALVLPYRAGHAKGHAIEQALRTLGRVEPVTEEIASWAARLRARRRLKLPDALILATAVRVRAHEILTFDQKWRSVDTRVRVLQP